MCRLPSSYKECGHKKNDPLRPIEISIPRAREQHTEYIAILRKLGLDVIELPADDTLPESVFVDCTAIICNGTALIARPHLNTRKKEVSPLDLINASCDQATNVKSFPKTELIKSILKKEGLTIIEITDQQSNIDASDVLYTGREFFVGLSKYTNFSGAKALASAFPDIPVALVKNKKGLHLKTYVCVAGPDLLAVNSSDLAKDILNVSFRFDACLCSIFYKLLYYDRSK